jgi:hypothetical protein
MHKTQNKPNPFNKTADKTKSRGFTTVLLTGIAMQETPSLEAICSSGRKEFLCNPLDDTASPRSRETVSSLSRPQVLAHILKFLF